MHKTVRFFTGLLSSLALFIAALSFAQPVNANTITIDGSSATIACTAPAIDPACEGFTQGGSPASPTMAGVLSPTIADVYELANSGTATETAALNVLIGGGTETGAVQNDTGGVDTLTFTTNSLYFLIKAGKFTSFYHNLAGLITLTVNYVKVDGFGISHLTTWGGTTLIPLPAALPLFGTGLGILGFMGWRRRRQAAAAV